jgi:hypothetical protein
MTYWVIQVRNLTALSEVVVNKILTNEDDFVISNLMQVNLSRQRMDT